MAGSFQLSSEQSKAVGGVEYLDKLEELLTHEEILNSIEFFTLWPPCQQIHSTYSGKDDASSSLSYADRYIVRKLLCSVLNVLPVITRLCETQTYIGIFFRKVAWFRKQVGFRRGETALKTNFM